MIKFPPRKKAAAAADEQKQSTLADLIAFYGPGAARWSGRDGASLAFSGYRNNVIVYRCVQMIADAASSIEIQRCDADGLVVSDGTVSPLQRPNPEQTSQSLLETLYGHLQIHGNAYVEVIWADDRPLALYSLRPDRVRVETDSSGWPTAYVYTADNRRRTIPAESHGRQRVVHLRLFSPLDDLYGQSPLVAAGNAVDIHNAALNWNKSLLDNAARPSGALIYKGPKGAENLTGDQFDRLKSELSDTYASSVNAGRPMVLDGGLEWRPMSLSPAEMDFQELKNSAARDIALAFGVPPMLLGIRGDNTYSNYQQAVLALWRQTVLPLAHKVISAIGDAVLPSDCHYKLLTDSIDALIDGRLARLEVLLETDVLSHAEKRALLGYAQRADEA